MFSYGTIDVPLTDDSEISIARSFDSSLFDSNLLQASTSYIYL